MPSFQYIKWLKRALSPGVNDPYTGIACIDYLTFTMCYHTRINLPSKFSYDEEGNLRVIADTLTYEGITDAAFNQIRQFSGSSLSVTIR